MDVTERILYSAYAGVAAIGISVLYILSRAVFAVWFPQSLSFLLLTIVLYALFVLLFALNVRGFAYVAGRYGNRFLHVSAYAFVVMIALAYLSALLSYVSNDQYVEAFIGFMYVLYALSGAVFAFATAQLIPRFQAAAWGCVIVGCIWVINLLYLFIVGLMTDYSGDAIAFSFYYPVIELLLIVPMTILLFNASRTP